jgi:hypothetical protein
MRRMAAILAILLAHGCDRVVDLSPPQVNDAPVLDARAMERPPDAAFAVDAGSDAGVDGIPGPDAP